MVTLESCGDQNPKEEDDVQVVTQGGIHMRMEL
jgi:hypothetical protein